MEQPTDGGADRVGPYASRGDAAADARLVEVLAGRGEATPSQVAYDRLVTEARHAGVELGAYDQTVLWDVADRLGPEHAQSVLGLVARAHAAGYTSGYHE